MTATRSSLLGGAASTITAIFALAMVGGEPAAQPTFGNPSPTAGSSTSKQANAAADAAVYKEIEYVNKGTKGPALVVIPGEVKSTDTTFAKQFKPDKIADFAEIELSQANFGVVERRDIGPSLQQISRAYNLGDAEKARSTMQVGNLKTAKWIVRFDILKAEQVSDNKGGVDGGAAADLAAKFGFGGSKSRSAAKSVKTQESTQVWLVGMRYKIMDAGSAEQVAQGYKELKMEIGSSQTEVMGVSQSAKGGIGLDTLVQRLVQTAVYEIDSKYK